MYQRTEPCQCPRQHPAQERERTVHVALGKHGYIERVERHRMAFGHDETMLRSKLLDGRGSEVPQVSGYIIGSPVGSILAGIVRRTVRNCYQQHSLVCQQGVQSFPCLAVSGCTSSPKCALANSRAEAFFSTASTCHPSRFIVSAK